MYQSILLTQQYRKVQALSVVLKQNRPLLLNTGLYNEVAVTTPVTVCQVTVLCQIITV